MTRLLATTALVGALLAAPALAQTMNSAPTPAPAGTTSTAQPQMSAPDTAQTDQSQAAQPQAARTVKHHAARTESSGSSMRSKDKSADNSADQLNRQELSQLKGQ